MEKGRRCSSGDDPTLYKNRDAGCLVSHGGCPSGNCRAPVFCEDKIEAFCDQFLLRRSLLERELLQLRDHGRVVMTRQAASPLAAWGDGIA